MTRLVVRPVLLVLFLIAWGSSVKGDGEEETHINNPNQVPPVQHDPYPHPRDELHAQHHNHPHQTTVNNDNEHHSKLYTQNHQHHQQPSTTSRVLELSDRFLEIVNAPVGGPQVTDQSTRYNQPWLVMFYAPWCGHCKRLEPIFNHVAQALHSTPIRVGKIDCTRFPSVGSEYKIHGYPTIMFISGPSRRHTFQGDRELSNIVRFATRMAAPPVTLSPLPLSKFLHQHLQHLSSTPPHEDNPARVKRSEMNINSVSGGSTSDIFFGLLRPIGFNSKLTDAFKTVTGKYQQHNEFYEFTSESKVVAFAVKHGRVITFEYEQPAANITSLLENWVGHERFPDFIHLTRGNLYQLFSEADDGVYSKELIVCAVVEEDKLERVISAEEKRLLGVIQGVTNSAVELTLRASKVDTEAFSPLPVASRGLPHTYAWIGSPDLANSIVAEQLPLPTLLIIQKSTSDHNHKYYVFSDPKAIDSEPKIENILELVREGHFSPRVHANSFSFKLYRYLFDAKTSLTDMWVGNPVLTIVLFGLPLGFLSLILYSVCCGDIMDAKEEEEGEEDVVDDSADEDAELLEQQRRNHEKRE